jgi:hypothetical protein
MNIVIGPVLKHPGGYGFDVWTAAKGLTRGYPYCRIEDALLRVEGRDQGIGTGSRPGRDGLPNPRRVHRELHRLRDARRRLTGLVGSSLTPETDVVSVADRQIVGKVTQARPFGRNVAVTPKRFSGVVRPERYRQDPSLRPAAAFHTVKDARHWHPRGRGGADRPHADDASGVARPPVNAVFILWLRQLKLLFRSRARMPHRRDPARNRRLGILEDRGVAVGGAAANASEAPTGAAVPVADGPASHSTGAPWLAFRQ